MGKDLKGRLLDKGITQEKSGYYVARYVDRFGKRQSKRFKKYQEARQWLADSKYLDESSNMLYPQNMTVNAWFDYWIEIKKTSLRPSTIQVYTSIYNNSIKDVIGDMKMSEVKPLHCQMILSKMADKDYYQGTIKHTRIVLYGMFECAKENDIIISNPIKRSMKIEIGKPSKTREALSIEDQKKLFNALIGHKYEYQYKLVTILGLRVGELIGIKYEDISFDKKYLKIQRTMRYSYSEQKWQSGPPKSKAGYRTIPLTDTAIDILKKQIEKNQSLKVVPIEYKDYVFINENGLIKYGSYDSALQHVCKKINIKPITIHNLRHTYASRCIEAGMSANILKVLLGHASLNTTMDIYVHVFDEEIFKEVNKVSDYLNVI